MQINLTDYFEVQGKRAEIAVTLSATEVDNGYETFPIVDCGDISLMITNIGDDKVEIKGELTVTVESPCSRCLKPVKTVIPVSFEYSVVKPDGFHEIDEEEQFFMNGYVLDTETLINNELIMSLPMKVLCKETCKGLCPVCGKNLNDGECGCDTFIPDPRMAAISDIFNASKEV